MGRYLIKSNLNKRTLEYVSVPKKAILQRIKGGYRGKIGKRVGVPLKGYELVRAKSFAQAKKEFFKREIGKELRYNKKHGL